MTPREQLPAFPPREDRLIACRILTRLWGESLAKVMELLEKGELGSELWDHLETMSRLYEMLKGHGCQDFST